MGNKSGYKKVKVKLTESSDGDFQPIQCLCGYGKAPWDFYIGTDEYDSECPKCARKYFWKNLGVEVYLKDDRNE